jgi:parallel beta-helix repeat protein
MRWDLRVLPGAYRVRLYFTETARRAQARRARVFDVRIEGATVLDNLDVFATARGFKAIARSFSITSDANLDIDFRRVIGNPSVNAIEVVPVQRTAPRDTEPSEAGAGPSPHPGDGAPCRGTVISPEDDLAAAVNGTSGRTFCLLPGTHDIRTNTVQPGSGTKLIGAPVTITAPGTITAPTKIRGSSPDGIIEFSRPATGVVIENLDICCAPGTKLDDDNSTKQLGRGINGSSQRAANFTVRFSRIHGNANAGIGGIGEGAVIDHVELDHNGSDSYLGCCAGGIKSANFYSITNSFVHDNVGNGIWVDSGGSFMVSDNVVRNNTKNGVRYEHSTGYARILRNVVQNNSTSRSRPGGGIEVNSADDAEIAFNTLGRNFHAGIIFRGSRSPVSGVAYNNVLNGDRLECGMSGVSCYDNALGRSLTSSSRMSS